MPRGVYERTEENRKKIGEARRRYYDEHRKKDSILSIRQSRSLQGIHEALSASGGEQSTHIITVISED